jgi:hypothetical protein
VVGGAFLGGVKLQRLDIYHSVGHLGPRWTGSFIEKPTFTEAHLFSVRVIVAIMCVLMVEQLCRSVMGWISAIQCCYISWAQPYQPFPVLKTPRYGCWGARHAPCWVMRRAHSGLTSGGILLAYAYREEMEERVIVGSNSF